MVACLKFGFPDDAGPNVAPVVLLPKYIVMINEQHIINSSHLLLFCLSLN